MCEWHLPTVLQRVKTMKALSEPIDWINSYLRFDEFWHNMYDQSMPWSVGPCVIALILVMSHDQLTAAVAQSVRALAPQAEGWVFESQPRQT